MRVSLIIAVYKDFEALDLILNSLSYQTYKYFEVVVAEDGNDPSIKKTIERAREKFSYPISHTTQEDKGIRKAKSQNNGIIAAKNEYLIFIDGDCIPYSTFIESHVRLSEQNAVVTGRRVNLGPKFSQLLRKDKLSPLTLEKFYPIFFPFVAFDSKERHPEDGFRFRPDGLIASNRNKFHKPNTQLLGCNFSCPRDLMLKINGFDEGYGNTPVSDDTDLQWRFEFLDTKFITAKNIANLFHLHHSRDFRNLISSTSALELMQKNKSEGKYRCKNGIDTHF